jgi:hypothetical protein
MYSREKVGIVIPIMFTSAEIVPSREVTGTEIAPVIPALAAMIPDKSRVIL